MEEEIKLVQKRKEGLKQKIKDDGIVEEIEVDEEIEPVQQKKLLKQRVKKDGNIEE